MEEHVTTNSSAETSATTAPTYVVSPDIAAERQAIALAQEFFPGSISVVDVEDPEDPTWRRRAIVVSAVGEARDVVAREFAWHERMIAELGSRGDHITIDVRRVSA